MWFTQLRFKPAPGRIFRAIKETKATDIPLFTKVRHETRVYAPDPSARKKFAAYWRIIYPGAALIRRTWLRSIKRRAENG